ncbi:MAG: hypothetical protein RMM29_02325 [Planctomycetota bacterium]|nr:hypothetical protein [Planctomycetota bacterium]MCX8040231.1 hypothetical protein [Planctomycetota bacterium]MDW8372474.1 hypothetical protein [Planctomycetota bacterium]
MSEGLPCDPDLFDLLVCPLARTPLKWVEGRLVSTDRATRRAYRVQDGIPVMLVEESEELALAEWQRLIDLPGPVGQGAEAVRRRHGLR